MSTPSTSSAVCLSDDETVDACRSADCAIHDPLASEWGRSEFSLQGNAAMLFGVGGDLLILRQIHALEFETVCLGIF
jgi:hypothetical protein